MKVSVATLLLTLVAGPALAAGPKDTLDAFFGALASGDKAKAASLMDPQVNIFESGFAERSRGEYANRHLGSDIEFAKSTSRRIVKHSERIAGNVAVIWEEVETTGKVHGKPVRIYGTETAVLENRAGKWLITHVNWSTRELK